MSMLTNSRMGAAWLAMGIGLLSAACGESGVDSSEAAAATSIGSDAETTTSSTTAPPPGETDQATEPQPAASEPEIRPFGMRTLIPGRYRTTTTDPVLTFEVPDHGDDIRWLGRLETPWGIILVLHSDLTPRDAHGPGVAIAVAEPGSTIDSVVAAMEASDPSERYSFDVRRGSFAGREAAIVSRVSNRTGEQTDLIQVGTGEESYFNSMYAADRQSESYVYELDGRVVIVTLEAQTSQVDQIAAEGGAILESLAVGVP